MYEPRMEISRLAGFLALSLHEPVVDATGLTGAYEVRLYWAVDVLQSLTDDAGGIGETGPSLVQAIQQQLGLRVVRSEKVPFEVLVVDHADKVPIPN